MLWNKPGQQVTVFAEITDNTLKALRAILGPSQDGYHDTDDDDQPAPAGHPINTLWRPRWYHRGLLPGLEWAAGRDGPR
jgi:hypothetical protein